ncbi:hypothetical protein FEZ41_08915 [Lentilactobacillus parafarraginis]|jgi:vacuolar-type H+-ATPase subunit I/STV1|uniref:Antitoxin n=2 Tax=Lentilactobacillus parafarraginis TaxID=390842 RepID=A0A0R1YP58_9LACO|nr:hypothetical protein [Lentilactobacillus parafarraginis]KRM43669.1 hypothetical protein FD47_GL001471 [Lentilactobacillus parafarraginis DSM 18390 = JCM 14109]TLQ18587.1 hypothetical protein FEZ41_08915 [Lentilactobacillus parafarraginis]
MAIYTPSSLRKNLFKVLKDVLDSDDEVEVAVQEKNQPTRKSVVIIDKEKLDKLKRDSRSASKSFYDTPEAKAALREAVNGQVKTIGNGSLEDFDKWISKLDDEAKKNRKV